MLSLLPSYFVWLLLLPLATWLKRQLHLFLLTTPIKSKHHFNFCKAIKPQHTLHLPPSPQPAYALWQRSYLHLQMHAERDSKRGRGGGGKDVQPAATLEHAKMCCILCICICPQGCAHRVGGSGRWACRALLANCPTQLCYEFTDCGRTHPSQQEGLPT